MVGRQYTVFVLRHRYLLTFGVLNEENGAYYQSQGNQLITRELDHTAQRGFLKAGHVCAKVSLGMANIIAQSCQTLPTDREKLAVVIPTDDSMGGIRVSDQSIYHSLINFLTRVS